MGVWHAAGIITMCGGDMVGVKQIVEGEGGKYLVGEGGSYLRSFVLAGVDGGRIIRVNSAYDDILFITCIYRHSEDIVTSR